jgi:hypothetical protein
MPHVNWSVVHTSTYIIDIYIWKKKLADIIEEVAIAYAVIDFLSSTSKNFVTSLISIHFPLKTLRHENY